MKKNRKFLAAFLLLGALVSCGNQPTEQPTEQPSQQETVQPSERPTQEVQGGLEEALVNIAVNKTCYLTTVGQADSDIVGNVFKKAGAVGAYTIETMLKASDVAEGSVVFLTLGASSKGLGAAGVDEASERARAAEFASAAQEGKFTLILFHVGGTARRGTSSDPIIEAAFPGAAACFLVSTGNEDGFFTNLASTNNVSLYEVDKALSLVDYAKGLFGKAE